MKEWLTLSKEDRECVREARTEEGIPTRSVSSVSTKRRACATKARKKAAMEVESDNQVPMQVDPSLLKSPPPPKRPNPPLQKPPGVLKTPSIGALKTSRRDATCSNKKQPPHAANV